MALSFRGGRNGARVLGLVCILVVSGVLGAEEKSKERSKASREECVQPHDIEPLKEGMTLVYSQEDAAASKWFSKQCYNTTHGEMADNCACFYWGFKAHTAANNTKAAERSLDAALELAPRDAKLRSFKGESYAKREQFIKAAEQFKLAAKHHDPDADDADEELMKHWYNAATAYVQVGNAPDALECYEEVLKTSAGAQKWAVHNSVGLLHYDLGQLTEAKNAYEEALDLESDQPAVLRNLAGVYMMMEKPDAAIPLLKISAARDPSTFEAWFYLGAAHEQVGDFGAAKQSFAKAVEINPKHSEARRHYGLSCWELEDLECGERELEEAVALATKQSLQGGCEALSNLGNLYLQANMGLSAEKVFLRALQRCGCSFSKNPDKCQPEGALLLELGLAELSQRKVSAANASLSAALEQDALLEQSLLFSLLFARAALADFDGVRDGLLRYRSGGQGWAAPEPEEAAVLGLHARTLAILRHQFAAEKTDMALAAVPTGAVPLQSAGGWLGVGSEMRVLKIGVLVCSAALRGAHWQALKVVLRAGTKGGRQHAIVVYDWCQQSQLEEGEGEGVGEGVLSAMGGGVPGHVTAGHVGKMSAWAAAQAINKQALTALLALDGWSPRNKNGILAHQPCPVQLSALGGYSPALADPRLVQHMLGGRVSSPPELSTALYHERLLLLPLGAAPPTPTDDVSIENEGGAVVQTSRLHEADGEVAALRAKGREGLGPGAVAMAVFAKAEEVTAEAAASWGAILAQTEPACVLVLPGVAPDVQRRLRAEVERGAAGRKEGKGKGGVSARVLFGNETLKLAHRLHAADMALDSWGGVSGGPVLGRAASLGKPFVALPLEAFHSRSAAEQGLGLSCRGCGYARSPEDFSLLAAAMASRLASHPPRSDLPLVEYGSLAEQWGESVVRGVALAVELKWAALQGEAEGGDAEQREAAELAGHHLVVAPTPL